MNKLKLKEFSEERVVYFYQPEGKGSYGEIAYVFSERRQDQRSLPRKQAIGT
jgi:hypothetical protein